MVHCEKCFFFHLKLRVCLIDQILKKSLTEKKTIQIWIHFLNCAPSAQSLSPSFSTLHLCFHTTSTAKKKKETLSCFLIFLLFCLSGFPPFYISYFFLLSLKLRGFRRCLLDRRRSFSRICEFVRGETCVSHKSWHLPDFILCVSECMWAWSCLRYHFVFGYFSRFQ